MAENTIPSEPLFRANKRRKVFRKRGDSNGSNEALPSVPVAPNEAEFNVDQGQSDVAGGVLRLEKKGGARKYGIGFSSTDGRRNPEQEQGGETALVPMSEKGAKEVLANDRFVKPTGRVGVTEDKNMMAYVDSKLAEMRSSVAPPSSDNSGQVSQSLVGATRQEDVTSDPQRDTDVPALPANRPAPTSDSRTFQQAQSRSARAYQRPTKRRQLPPRDETDLARDSMIDQIMRGNQVTVYDRTASHTSRTVDDDSVDNDTAAAEAFKAELLADMERNTRRRPPVSSSSSTAKGAGSMQTGPKLGGSRAQREKMRAMEETKAREGKK